MSDLNRVSLYQSSLCHQIMKKGKGMSDSRNGVSNTVTALMVLSVWPIVFPVDTCINKIIMDVK